MANSITGIGGSSSSPQVDLLSTSVATKQAALGGSQVSNENTSPTVENDATSLSSLGSFIAKVSALAAGQSSIRPEVVASIKAQITAGTYRPDPDKVAARVAAALTS
jgi:flagellar biosynthesis anti-sigma factor FlgM